MGTTKCNTLERPQCEFRGAVPHPAAPAYLLVWDLQSGTVAKWSCGCHRFSFGGRPYWVNRCEGLEDGKPPRTHEYAALRDAPEAYRLGGDEDEGFFEDEAPEEKSLVEQLESDLVSALAREKKQPTLAAQPSPEDDVIGALIEENLKRGKEKQRALAAQEAAESTAPAPSTSEGDSDIPRRDSGSAQGEAMRRKKYFGWEQAFEFIWQNADREGLWLGDASSLAAEFDASEQAADAVLDELRDRSLIEKLDAWTFFISKWREKDDPDEARH